MHLHEKYRPKKIESFIGLNTAKKVLLNFATQPMAIPLLFVGRSGRGKSAMAYALAGEIGAELHISPAHECTRENVAALWNRCRHIPSNGSEWHMILVDQADRLTKPHQSDLRSKLDGPDKLPNVIWVFTAESTDGLDEGFRSRCLQIPFSNHGDAPALAAHLQTIWNSEYLASTSAQPNFTRILKEANGDMLRALTELQRRLA